MLPNALTTTLLCGVARIEWSDPGQFTTFLRPDKPEARQPQQQSSSGSQAKLHAGDRTLNRMDGALDRVQFPHNASAPHRAGGMPVLMLKRFRFNEVHLFPAAPERKRWPSNTCDRPVFRDDSCRQGGGRYQPQAVDEAQGGASGTGRQGPQVPRCACPQAQGAGVDVRPLQDHHAFRGRAPRQAAIIAAVRQSAANGTRLDHVGKRAKTRRYWHFKPGTRFAAQAVTAFSGCVPRKRFPESAGRKAGWRQPLARGGSCPPDGRRRSGRIGQAISRSPGKSGPVTSAAATGTGGAGVPSARVSRQD